MNKVIRSIVLIGLSLMLCVFVACGKTDDNEPGQIELLVDMHGWMPTENDVPTIENPKVIKTSRLIAEEFTKQTGIKIRWARSKPVGGDEAEIGQWFATQIAGENCPVIAFSWGTKYQDRNYYVDLSQYFDTPNEYVEGNTAWKDQYEDYLLQSSSVMDANGKIVAVPISLYPGPATGYFYNKDLFAQLQLSTPSTFEQFTQTADKIKAAGKVGVAPWGYFKKYTLDAWIVSMSIGPAIANTIMDQTDLNGDGRVTVNEQLKAVKADLYNPKIHDYAREYYKLAKRYYTEVLPSNWLGTDYMNAWDTGEVGMKEEGLWALYDQYNKPSIEYEVGVFPIPMLSTDTTSFVNPLQMTEKGPSQPEPDLLLNIMKPAIEKNPELLEPAIKFLKFLTQTENISAMCIEQGAVLGAVKGAEYNSVLDEYLDQPFPVMPKTAWPIAFTSNNNDKLNRSFGLWVIGSKTDSEFYDDVVKYQAEGAKDFAQAMGIAY